VVGRPPFSVVVSVVVTMPSTPVTATFAGTATVIEEVCDCTVCASLNGQNMMGAHKAMMASADPKAFINRCIMLEKISV